MFGALLLVALTILIFVVFVRPYRKYGSLRRFTETSHYWPLIGHIHVLLKNNFLDSISIAASAGLPAVLWEGPQPMYVTSDPKEIKIVLNHPNSLNKAQKFRYFFKDVFGESILIADAEKWKKNRKILSKAFQQNILDSFVYIFQEKSEVLVEILTRGSPSDLYYTFQQFSTDNFLITNTGIDNRVQLGHSVDIVKYLIRGQKVITERYFKPYFWNKFMFDAFGGGRKLDCYVRKAEKYMTNILESKKQSSADNNVYNEKNAKPIMDLMLDLNDSDKLDEAYIINELRVFFYAATDTSAYTMTFTCTLLGMFPEIQDKLYNEVVNVIGLDHPVDSHNLSQLKYTEMVINEALRLFPVVPIIGRSISQPVDIDTVVLPEDTQVIMSIFHLHRDPRYYPDPLKFDPDRFSTEEIAKRPQYTFIPFSGGPRNCIGWKYAMMLMKTALANIIRNFRIHSNYKSVNDLKLASYIVMRTTHMIDCTFVSRKTLVK